MKLSSFLLDQRVDLGKTKQQMAKILLMTFPTYQRLENGTYNGNLQTRTLAQLAMFYKVKPSEIKEMHNEDKQCL